MLEMEKIHGPRQYNLYYFREAKNQLLYQPPSTQYTLGPFLFPPKWTIPCICCKRKQNSAWPNGNFKCCPLNIEPMPQPLHHLARLRETLGGFLKKVESNTPVFLLMIWGTTGGCIHTQEAGKFWIFWLNVHFSHTERQYDFLQNCKTYQSFQRGRCYTPTSNLSPYFYILSIITA